jgi:hypothetical protein
VEAKGRWKSFRYVNFISPKKVLSFQLPIALGAGQGQGCENTEVNKTIKTW